MNDEELLRELRDSARRADEAPLPPELAEPLGILPQEQIVRRILASRIAPPKPAPRFAKVRTLYVASAFSAMAAAAAVLVFSLKPPSKPSLEELPSYGFTVTGGTDSERSEPAAQTRLTARAGDQVSVLLRPTTDVTGALEVHAFATRKGASSPSQAKIQSSASGSVKLQGTLADMVGPSEGDAELTVVVEREGAHADALAIARGASAPRGVYVARVPARVVRLAAGAPTWPSARYMVPLVKCSWASKVSRSAFRPRT